MTHRIFAASMFALLLLVTVDIAYGLTKVEVVDRLVATYGGETAFGKLNAVHQLWKIHVVRSGTQGHDFRKILLPNHLLVDLTYPNRNEQRLISLGTGYRSSNGSTLQRANPLQRDAMQLQLMRLYSPLILRRNLARLEFQDDRYFGVLSLTAGSLRVDYLVNKGNWHIEKVIGTMAVNGSQMQFLTEYSDFRMVDGVLIHYRENKYTGDVNTARLDLLEIEFDAKLHRQDFLSSEGI